jgi:hypothetical protein
MKTAIQQLIERLEEEDINVPFLIKSVYLEKEKEQMFYWFYGGGGLSATDDFRKEFEKNYNQTYNQNK